MDKSHESYLVPFFKEMNAVFPNKWCVLHSYETLPFYSESDVDMAFSGNDVAQLESVIKRVAQNQGWQVYQKLWYDVQYCQYYVLKHNEKDVFLAIDFLIDNEGIGKYGFKTSTLTSDCVVIKDSFPIPNPEVAFCYKLTKRIVKKRALLEDRPYLVKQFEASEPAKINEYLKIQFGSKGKDIILKYLKNQKSLPTKDEIRFLNQKNTNKNPSIKRRYWEVKRTLNRIFQPNGMIIEVPLLKEEELKLFCDLLEQKMDILFRFVKINKTNSVKTKLTGLAGSTLVICSNKKFNPNKALQIHWLPAQRIPIKTNTFKKGSNITGMVDLYYAVILEALQFRMSKRLGV